VYTSGSESLAKEMFVWLGDFKNEVRLRLDFSL